MTGRLTMWGAGELLTVQFSQLAEPPPSYWLALIAEVAPTPYISGSELDEPSVENGYTRVEIPNDTLHWNNDGQMHVVSLNQEIVFPTATGDWGDIRYWALCNAEVEGYVYFVGEMETPISVLTDDSVVVAEGDLSISLGPFYSAGDN